MLKVNGNTVGDTLTQFIGDFGAPAHLTFDGASVQTGPRTRFMEAIHRYEIKYHVSGPCRPNENPAEQSTHKIKNRWCRIMLEKKVPPRLWDYGFAWVCEVENICANFSKYAEGRTPLEIVTGDMPDISEDLTNAERATDETRSRMLEYEEKLKTVLDAQSADITRTLRDIDISKVVDPDNEDPEFFEEFARVIDNASLHPADDAITATGDVKAIEVAIDQYIGMELALLIGDDGTRIHARVTKCMRDEEGRPIGTAHDNPLLDSRRHGIEYVDGNVEELTASIIAENLIAQVDDEGRRQMMFEEIIDHRTTPEAVPKSEGTYVNQYGVRRQKQTTRGWELLIQWRDGSTDWIALKDFKESYPVEMALYATNRGIHEEPAFAWWVPYVLKKQKRIIQKVKSKY
ncbi:Reverse transcriptase (RNA-dependent DNA polymerase) [Fragilaria crotonensis]|nr:Reverse transcriptase (RNA-dependent DNA polymerase) [Fragilaria crotonensis]